MESTLEPFDWNCLVEEYTAKKPDKTGLVWNDEPPAEYSFSTRYDIQLKPNNNSAIMHLAS